MAITALNVNAIPLTKGSLVITQKTTARFLSSHPASTKEIFQFSIYYGGRVATGYFRPRQRPLLSPEAAYLMGQNAPKISLFQGKLRRNKNSGFHVAASLDGNKLQINFTDSREIYSATVFIQKQFGPFHAKIHRVPAFFKIDNEPIIKSLPANSSLDNNSIPEALEASTQANAYTIQISTVADPELSILNGSDSAANSKILSIINTAETIYENQLSLGFSVIKQTVLPSGTFTSTLDPTGLLNEFTSYENHYDNSDKDSAHLFTGRNLSGSTIGLAYLSVMCLAPSFTYGLTQVKNNEALAGLTFAHETGHNLGASHDDINPSLMSSSISPSRNSFSNLSLSQINSHISNYTSCLLDSNSDRGGENNPDYQIGKLNVTSGKQFKMVLRLNSGDGTGCNISVYGSGSYTKLSASNIESQGILLTQVAGGTGKVIINSTNIAKKLSVNKSIKFRLHTTCEDFSAFSNIKELTLSAGGNKSVKSWLNQLKNSSLSVNQD